MANSNEIGIVATGLYATPKDVFIKYCERVISNMKKEIKEMENQMLTMDHEDYKYKQKESGIAKRRSIIKDCEQSIFITQSQMNVKTHVRFRGI